jgi:uncharacterized protein (TIGR02246 family)
MIRLMRIGVLVAALAAASCSQPPAQPAEPPDTRAADEAAIHALIKDWSAAAAAKDAERFAAVYAPDAVLMMEDAPDTRGIAALREAASGMMQDPNFALAFNADRVVVARAGDMAYETGTYSLTMSGENGEPATESGHYVVVWQKDASGAWKVVIDAPVSDPPS